MLTDDPVVEDRRSEGTELLATGVDIPLPRPDRVERIWFEAQPRITPQPGDDRSLLGPLLLRAVVGRPRRPGSRDTALLDLSKPLIDGLLSACSAHDRRDMPLVADRVAARLAVPRAEVGGRLLCELSAPLGPRRLLWPFRDFVQWNPADDRLVEVDLMVEDGETDSVDFWLASAS